jgi:anti-sigma-K factor RskA
MNLSRPDRRDRLDRLAAEFALGTSPPRVRRRLDAIAARDRIVAEALNRWEQRLAGLADRTPPVTPPPRVWRGIAARLGLESQGDRAEAPTHWWERLVVWQSLAVASLLVAVVLGVSELTRAPAPATAPIVVVLAGADAKPALIATASRDDRLLTLKSVANTAPPTGRVFELWALPQAGAPRSLGVIPAGPVVNVPLRLPAGESLTNIPSLAVSVEPPGGSPTGQPTGPVVYSGAVERMY